MNEDVYGVIYCLTNEKKYFGQTINIKERWNYHKNCNDNTYIHRAIRKHGWDNFKKEVICKCGDKLSLGLMEDFCIQVFNTLAPNGYNLKRGGVHGKRPNHSKRMMGENNSMWGKMGENSPMYGVRKFGKDNPNYGKKWSKEKKQIASNKMKEWYKNHPEAMKGENHPMFGKHHTKETLQLQSDVKIGEKNPMYGKKHSEETKRKRKNIHKNRQKIFCKYCNKKYKYPKNLENHKKICKEE